MAAKKCEPQRRWCLVNRDNELVPIDCLGLLGESFVEFMQRMCKWFGEPIGNRGMSVVEVEVREVVKRPAKKRGRRRAK